MANASPVGRLRANVDLKMPDCCCCLQQEHADIVASFDSDLHVAARKLGVETTE